MTPASPCRPNWSRPIGFSIPGNASNSPARSFPERTWRASEPVPSTRAITSWAVTPKPLIPWAAGASSPSTPPPASPPPAPRLDFHVFTGEQDYEDQQLRQGSVGKNLMFGGNLYFRVAPNVLLGPEASQFRTFYVGQGTRINNHYDLALAYLF